MQDGRHARGGMSTLEFEDVVTVDLPDDGYVDRDFLRDVFRDPQTYLPLRRRRAVRELEDLPREVESVLARRAKLTGLVTAVTALICAVVAAAALAERPTRAGEAESSPQRSVTGVDALGAFTVAEAGRLGSVGGAPATASSTPNTRPPRSRATSRESATQAPARPGPATSAGTSTRAPETTSASEPTVDSTGAGNTGKTGRTGGTPERTEPPETAVEARAGQVSTPAAQPTSSQATSELESVRRFYGLVATSPEQALGMLDPGLLGNALGELRAAWRSLDDVRILEISERRDGSVLAVVTMRHPDGSLVRMTQLFEFSAGGLIDHVQLLSAQHS